MHDWITAALLTADSASSSNLKVGIIAAVALVVASAVPSMLSTREREPRALRDARVDMTKQRDRLQKRTDWLEDYVEALEAIAWEHKVDPRNVKPPNEPS